MKSNLYNKCFDIKLFNLIFARTQKHLPLIMNELTTSINELKTKVEKLVALNRQFKNENEKLNEENKSLKHTLEEQKDFINTLQIENQKTIDNKGKEQNKIVTDSKLKIDELVQEIDNCIGLLK